MLRQFIGGVVRSEVGELKRSLTGLVFVLAAAVLVLLAVGFAFLALYLWLASQMEPWQAALVVTAVILIASIVLWLLGRLRMRHPRRRSRARRDAYEQELRAFTSSLTPDPPSSNQKVALIATAAVIGLIVGRKLSR